MVGMQRGVLTLCTDRRGAPGQGIGPMLARGSERSCPQCGRKLRMSRYAPRLVPAGTAPKDALVEPLIENPPTSPLGEHELIPQVAWMVERDGAFVHVPASQRSNLEEMRGYAMVTMLDDNLSNESLDHLPGVNLATNGTYAAELLLDSDHLAALHKLLGGRVYLAAAPRRGRFLVGGVGAGLEE